MCSAIEKNESTELERGAHLMVGAAATIGAQSIRGLAFQVDLAMASLPKLEEGFEKLKEVLLKY